MSAESKYYGVYRQFKSGKLSFIQGSCTTNKKLAEEIAADFSQGFCIMPDGSKRKRMCGAKPHIAKEI